MVKDMRKIPMNKRLYSGAAEDYSLRGCHAAIMQALHDVTTLLLDCLTLKMKAL
jgi:hypothetical protein